VGLFWIGWTRKWMITIELSDHDWVDGSQCGRFASTSVAAAAAAGCARRGAATTGNCYVPFQLLLRLVNSQLQLKSHLDQGATEKV
jgi:hypothetical protein